MWHWWLQLPCPPHWPPHSQTRQEGGPQRPRPDPGLFTTKAMGLHKVQLQLVLHLGHWCGHRWQGLRVRPVGATLALTGQAALVLKLAKQQILEGLQLTSRPRMTHPPPRLCSPGALRNCSEEE